MMAKHSTALALIGLAVACGSSREPVGNTAIVRVRTVFTPEDSGLLAVLAADFEAQTQLHVDVVHEQDVYGSARKGLADLVISHYGHRDVDRFVLDGSGRWPTPVFSNQMVLLGPPGDPAKVSGLTDVVLAYQRIAAVKAPFVANRLPGTDYLMQIIAEAAGHPDRSGWYVDEAVGKEAAMRTAAARGAYTLWGITPFLKLKARERVALEPMVVGDPILQRLMVSIVVDPRKHAGVNIVGAVAFQDYLVSPRAQAKIRAFRVPGISAQLWWPAARNNNIHVLQGE